ncbi:hypothetical protein CEP53_010781 [Fusarium sp. AF-6]|nr:hypothetical protein CEP53_010781 [Fusarium sp. AF-6]
MSTSFLLTVDRLWQHLEGGWIWLQVGTRHDWDKHTAQRATRTQPVPETSHKYSSPVRTTKAHFHLA